MTRHAARRQRFTSGLHPVWGRSAGCPGTAISGATDQVQRPDPILDTTGGHPRGTRVQQIPAGGDLAPIEICPNCRIET